jgi:hypothetical protein
MVSATAHDTDETIALRRVRATPKPSLFTEHLRSKVCAGFFVSAAGRDVRSPNRLIPLLYAGAALAVGVASLGSALLTS